MKGRVFMETKIRPQKLSALICSCSGSCPSMEGIDFWTLSDRIRFELGDKLEFIALHPRLCEEDGERLMERLLSDDLTMITSACAEKRQCKLLKEGFNRASVPMDDAHWIPLSMAQKDTDTVYEEIKKVVDDWYNLAAEGE